MLQEGILRHAPSPSMTVAMETTQPLVLTSLADGIATVVLNRPERRNGVTVGLCIALHDALLAVAESEARVVVLRGAGNDFCVGADLGGGGAGDRDHDPQRLRAAYHVSTLLHTMPQVTLAAIDGGCAGAGMGWAMACDLRLASDRARFNTAFLAVGASGDMGLGWSLARIVGGAKARELLFFPGRIAAERALDLGLVSRLLPAEVLHDETLAAAQELAGRDPLALRLMKANAVSAESLGIADYIEVETERHIEAIGQGDLAARMAQALAEVRAGKS